MDARYKMLKDAELSQKLVIDIQILNKNFLGEWGNQKYSKHKSKNIDINIMLY